MPHWADAKTTKYKKVTRRRFFFSTEVFSAEKFSAENVSVKKFPADFFFFKQGGLGGRSPPQLYVGWSGGALPTQPKTGGSGRQRPPSEKLTK